MTPFWVNFWIIFLPGIVCDKKLLQFWTRRKEPKTDPHSNPMQHMPSQPLTNIRSQTASTTINLMSQIYMPVFWNLINQNKSEQQLLMQFEAAKSQPYALSYQIHTSTSLMFYTSFTKLALFLKSMYLASSIVQMIE